MEHPFNLGPVLRSVFTVYAIFWAVVIVGLYFVVGLLLRKRGTTSSHHEGH